MNLDDFKHPSGKLIQVGQGDIAYKAFVPNPLPPRLEWDSEVVQALSSADRALGELAGLGRSLPNPHLLIGPFLRREAVLSSRIEGTETDITELYVYEAGQLPLPGMKPASSEPDAREVLNYVRALEYGLERLNKLPVSLRLIREIHEKLLHGVPRGKSRARSLSAQPELDRRAKLHYKPSIVHTTTRRCDAGGLGGSGNVPA